MRDEPSLFSGGGLDRDGALPKAGNDIPTETFVYSSDAPLAARMRPRSLDEFVGQRNLVGKGRLLFKLIESGRVPSLILWGPPGSGKTTLASLLAGRVEAAFVGLSAVTDGIPRIREIISEARARKKSMDRGTVLFVDEIHRFNRMQQDALLPHVEQGVVTLIGATTENPSFEVVAPLLSRTRVLVLTALTEEELTEICRRALNDEERGLRTHNLLIDDEALGRIALESGGDARRALNALETAADLVSDEKDSSTIGVEHVEAALQRRFARYDKLGEQHYNLISALHKSVRGSDIDAALYWLARMLDAGEDPMYLARRLVRMAVEDVGLADPGALRLTVAARDAYQFLGSPEGDLALAEAATYLALAPKSNAVYRAYTSALQAARDTPSASVPLHIRNAPTQLMKDLGYGAGYQYDHESEKAVAHQTYLPDDVDAAGWYVPQDRGWESEARRRLIEIREARKRDEWDN